jgi:hypothetical protein
MERGMEASYVRLEGMNWSGNGGLDQVSAAS